MIMLVFPVVGLLAGLLSRLIRPVSRLDNTQVEAIALPVCACVIEALSGYFFLQGTARMVSTLVFYAMLLLFCARNKGTWAALAGLGTLLNALVILLNGGAMPISRTAIENSGALGYLQDLEKGLIYAYCVTDEHTRLAVLGDMIPIRLFGRIHGFASIGDFIVCTGALLLCYRLGRLPRSREKEK